LISATSLVSSEPTTVPLTRVALSIVAAGYLESAKVDGLG